MSGAKLRALGKRELAVCNRWPLVPPFFVPPASSFAPLAGSSAARHAGAEAVWRSRQPDGHGYLADRLSRHWLTD